jgi:hypothetical protein
MNNIELVAWAENEAEFRKADLAVVTCDADLKQAQKNAAKRRKAIGLTASQATAALIALHRQKRVDAWNAEQQQKRAQSSSTVDK